jgi:hypothetical protein
VFERKVVTIAMALKNSYRVNKRGCTLLVGAGCSVTGGIPTAATLINQVKEMKPEACEEEVRLQQQFTYGDWMNYLATDERHDLFADYIDRAKINWAHICIASLMAAGYVDRILTTNFDPLIVQACALFGEFPAVYDFAASQYLKPHLIPRKAVFYLHGQRSGFILKNTPHELEEHAKYLAPIINNALPRIWIVVGYSGTSDPVFEHLATVDEFGHGLYWVGYEDREPAEHIRKRLLDESKKKAFYTKGYDADRFFDALIRELNIYPPRLVAEPFSHLHQILQRVSDEEKFKDTRQMIEKAIQQFERQSVGVRNGDQVNENELVEEAQRLMNAGDYDAVIRLRPHYEAAPSEAGAEYLARAYKLKGNKYAEAAKNESGPKYTQTVAQAAEQYETALIFKPDAHEVYNNWGALLHEQARRQGAAAADSLANVIHLYDSALQIKPDYFDALLNRAVAQADLSALWGMPEAAEHSDRAVADFGEALKLKPNSYEALTEWGEALRKLVAAQPERADSLLSQATQKYQEALKFKEDYVKALLAWGDVLLLQAGLKHGEEAEPLVDEAMDKFFKADGRSPGSNGYHLARYYALIGDDWGCRENLKRAKQYRKLPPPEYLENDRSFDSVRDADWFAEFVPHH